MRANERIIGAARGWALVAAWCVAARGADEDYGSLLPRVPPSEPAAAFASFHLVPGYRIELVAAEPLVVDPVAFDFDERGRLAVVEMRGYSERGDQGLGRIRLLEDRDGDGSYETSSVFAEGLAWPTAVAWYEGGLFVGVAPDILYLADDDGDGRADRSEVVFTGFQRSNVQGLLNSFQWGLDNRIHGATSSSGGDVGPPDQPSAAIALRGRDFAFDPRTRALTAVSGGAQHGLTFDRWGRKFVCHNSDHCQLVAVEQRYLERNPYQTVGGARRSIAVDGPQAEVYRTSPVEAWRELRTRLRVAGQVPGPVEGGGRAAGYFTSATGITSFEGDAWPAAQRGTLLVADVGSNLVHRKRLTPGGALPRAERIDEGTEFLTSDDVWFRPVQMANGPDGALYLADMYREVIEHPASLPEGIKRHLDLNSGNDRGRIYRIVPESHQHRPTPDLGRRTSAELAALLDHPNAWHRRTAARLLFERQARDVREDLEQLVQAGELPEGRLAALAALDGLGGASADTLVVACSDAHPAVRRWALTLVEPRLGTAPELVAAAVRTAQDADPTVARQAAFTLGELPLDVRLPPLLDVVRRHADDAEVLAAAATSLADGAGRAVETLWSDDAFRASSGAQQFLRALCAQIGAQQRADDVASVLRLARNAASEPARLAELLGALDVRRGSDWFDALVDGPHGMGRDAFERLLDGALADALADEVPLARRQAALALLAWAPEERLAELIEPLLQPAQPAEVQGALLGALRGCSAPAIAAEVLDQWPLLTPAVRQQAADLLYARPAWALRALEGVAAGTPTPADFGSGRLAAWAKHPDGGVRTAAAALAGAHAPPDPASALESYRDVLATAGDAVVGEGVFRRHCATCHQHQGIGYPLGPNLSSAVQRGREAILYNLLFPNSEVDPRYQTYVALTESGLAFSGMLADESGASLTLARGEGAVDTLPRAEIMQLENTGLSLMPEGLVRDIPRGDLIHLLQFLCQPSAEPADASPTAP